MRAFKLSLLIAGTTWVVSAAASAQQPYYNHPYYQSVNQGHPQAAPQRYQRAYPQGYSPAYPQVYARPQATTRAPAQAQLPATNSGPTQRVTPYQTYARTDGSPEHLFPTVQNPWYVGVAGHYAFVGDAEGEDISGTTPIRGKASFDSTLGIAGYFGYQPWRYLRIEGEINYRSHEASNISVTNTITGETRSILDEAEGSGDGTDVQDEYGFNYVAPMLNAYLEVPLTKNGIITPYVGAGIGWLFQRNGAEEDGMAYQFMVGNRSFLDDNMSFNLEYRYLATEDMFVDSPYGPYNVDAHSVGVGVNWHFN